jgi:hypothetical protein
MTDCALITGASSGIGRELARLHAARGGDVILTARGAEALETLARELRENHGVRAETLPEDLSDPAAPERLAAEIERRGWQVDILVNNAGFGGQGRVVDRERKADLAMVAVNVAAPVSLCHLFAPAMVARGRGRILNIGSTAGFAPGPNQAVYFASKAFVNSFSQALAEELRGTGVTVTAACPGYVETGFAEAGGLEDTPMVKAGGADATGIAKDAYEAMLDGRLVTIRPRRMAFLLTWLAPLLPRRLLLRLVGRTQANR